ncbi:MAG TPA: DoxX family protein [Nevskiaceae bacterium]|nr:DoxX family protein [Nevskiaceae bacterium]
MKPKRPSRPLLDTAHRVLRLVDALGPAGDVALRLWVGYAFFVSGLTKIRSWDTTVLLFEYEYRVPVLSPVIAATLGTFGELVLPILLVLGIAGRLAAAGLFVVNLVAVLSYPSLNDAGLFMHQAWGLALLCLVLRGPGRLSLDHLARRRLGWA